MPQQTLFCTSGAHTHTLRNRSRSETAGSQTVSISNPVKVITKRFQNGCNHFHAESGAREFSHKVLCCMSPFLITNGPVYFFMCTDHLAIYVNSLLKSLAIFLMGCLFSLPICSTMSVICVRNIFSHSSLSCIFFT